MKEKVYKILPDFLQNCMVYLYNRQAYKRRYGGEYKHFRKEKKENRTLSLEELKEYQKNRYSEFIEFVIQNSEYYKKSIGNIENVALIENISSLPIVNKEVLRNNIETITVKTSEKLEKSKTGGTTGKSLEVKFFFRDSQERFAFLDDFRSRFGYELGKKTAWFSGKSLLTDRDIKKKRFWKTDFINNVRYYSTFHIKDNYLKYYVENLISYAPEYFVGFPSTILEIAKYGIANGYNFPENTVKAVFPTAETITEETRYYIEKFFKAKLYNQYASSEGAPFIIECEKGNLHLELQTGVFEVLDENDKPAKSGRLIVTSFTTAATPLIRYDIGDSITLEEPDKICSCGNNNPLVKEILGRIDDFIYSVENGKINLGNVSNTLKDTKGIIRFQAVQNKLEELDLYVVIDKEIYSKQIEKVFIGNWKDRVGNAMKIHLHYVNEIPVEGSGKYRIVKNNIKDLL
ncbi:phenylacetate--CoA ligase family protein [Chryseobacterium lathyri]|uniref:Phenylacetate-CoA ligase n=1 Tax=Chryseobacterium lathyri TaxID=395933 RepID=A0ABT9SL79_9FLAO|nr:phenylacetate--CoA ligase family protein [Chryseobacterium lathyri]MDP9960028.1 phenylacetate-CoA ligase [Chryseobacterium lathyri]MDQ0064416.1 phenylacetate-CoA ligase [Chryseobacterium lathyri]